MLFLLMSVFLLFFRWTCLSWKIMTYRFDRAALNSQKTCSLLESMVYFSGTFEIFLI